MQKITKTISLVLALLMLIGIFTVAPVFAVSITCGDYEYEVLSDGTAEIINYYGTASDIVIPSRLNGCSVTGIGFCAFMNCNTLASVTISSGIKSISSFAFENCTNLKTITIPDGITKLGASAFYNTAYYNKASNWKNSVLYLGKYLIGAKMSISGSHKIISGTKLIADSAFESCGQLKGVTIPNTVNYVGQYAFFECFCLRSVTIPVSVKSIGKMAFGYMEKREPWDGDGRETFTIYGYTGTAGEKYAKNNDIKFVKLKRAQPMTVKASNKTVKYKNVRKKSVTVKALTVKKAQGKVSYKKLSGSKKITVNKKTGKLTVKKGTRKGTYTIKIKVTANGNSNYKSGSKTVKVKIKVK